ncbi:alpha/beta hydrolase [Methanolobus sp. ZRKC3]|uniref:alpha/beta fold hydrolase n=1 Tax=Methanolobus sp. ZRKC3 TaxID=3125786 RepID=UPI003252A50C
MKLKTNLILTLIFVSLAFSGCIGTDGESILQGSSKISINSSPEDVFPLLSEQYPINLISDNDEVAGKSRNYDTSEFSIVGSPVEYASVNGIDIGYREFGSGEPLLIIMPFATKMDMCNATFVKQLAESYRVILFDNRGMGYSSDNNESISISLLVDDTAGFMDALGLDSAHIFGSSMGSVIAQELTLAHPAKVNRLILSSTTYSLNVPQTEKLKNILQYRTFDPDTEPVLRNYAQGNLEWNGTYEHLPEIQNKVLLLTASGDVLTPPELSVKFAELVPDAQLIQFEGAGHLGEQYLPEEYANEILCFLEAD